MPQQQPRSGALAYHHQTTIARVVAAGLRPLPARWQRDFSLATEPDSTEWSAAISRDLQETLMQLPELYRRGVIRPLDDLAAAQLADHWTDGAIRVEWLALSDSLFDEVWDAGLFQNINDVCGVHISDYEEEHLRAAQLLQARQALRSRRDLPSQVSRFREALDNLLAAAHADGRAVYFIL